MALPSGYTLLEYIQSTGTQYVDTGFKPNQNTRIDAIAQYTATSGTFPAVFGARNGSSQQFWVFCNMSNGNFTARYNTQSINIPGAALDRHTISLSKNVFSLDDAEAAGSLATFQSAHNAYLFGVNDAGKLSYGAPLKMYACQVYDNGTLIRDYLPCKNASGAVGLWDDVNGVFYGNAGSGAFVAGPEVAAPDTPSGLAQIPGVTLRWSPVRCEGYRIYRDGTLIGTTAETVYTDTTAELNQTYVYTVTAYRANLESAPAALTVYTKAGYFYYAPYFTDATF